MHHLSAKYSSTVLYTFLRVKNNSVFSKKKDNRNNFFFPTIIYPIASFVKVQNVSVFIFISTVFDLFVYTLVRLHLAFTAGRSNDHFHKSFLQSFDEPLVIFHSESAADC